MQATLALTQNWGLSTVRKSAQANVIKLPQLYAKRSSLRLWRRGPHEWRKGGRGGGGGLAATKDAQLPCQTVPHSDGTTGPNALALRHEGGARSGTAALWPPVTSHPIEGACAPKARGAVASHSGPSAVVLPHNPGYHTFCCFLVQTKVSWRTVGYSRQPRGIRVQSCAVLR